MKVETRSPASGGGRSLSATITFEKSDLRLQNTVFGTVVELAGCTRFGEPGGPAFPVKIIQIALPPLTRPEFITVKSRRSQRITRRAVLVTPYQPPRPMSGRQRADHPSTVNGTSLPRDGSLDPSPEAFVRSGPYVAAIAELYEAAARSPLPLAQPIRTQHIGLVPVATVQLAPIRYRQDGTLEFHLVVEVTIALESAFQLAPPAGDAQGEPAGLDCARYLHEALAKANSVRWKAQADRLAGLIEATVVNPGDVFASPLPPPSTAGTVSHLIITDDYKWADGSWTPGDKAGDLVSAFEELADWHNQCGIASRVVKISDIVNNVYGDFKSDARDLQEVIRNFLKWAHYQWGVAWVLLGGDTGIVPVRWVSDGWWGERIRRADQDPPGFASSYWAGTYLKMNLKDLIKKAWGWPGNGPRFLLRPETAKVIPQGAASNAGKGVLAWYYVTDDTYATTTDAKTDYVRVEGPAEVIDGDLRWLYDFNRIPTDFYYASLDSSEYEQPGQHDWDVLGNGQIGLYGQTDPGGRDGICYQADVSVGRAPVNTTEEAITFVRKALTYQKFRRPDGSPLDGFWPCNVLFVSKDFWDRDFTQFVPDPAKPDGVWPAAFRYKQLPGTNMTLLYADTGQLPQLLLWKVRVRVSWGDERELDYGPNASRGWCFVVSETDLSASEKTISVGHQGSQVLNVAEPTPWILVTSDHAEELIPDAYILDELGPDSSMIEAETLRQQFEADFPALAGIKRLYQDDQDLAPVEAATAPLAHLSPDVLEAALNANPHLVDLNGHGSDSGCCYLDRGMASQLQNGLPGFIAYANSCLTNAFDLEPAMSEALIRNPSGGAVAYIGYTRIGLFSTLTATHKAIFHTLATKRHLGLAVDARLQLLSHPAEWKDIKWTILAVNLLGDPLMSMWPDQVWPVEGDIHLHFDDDGWHIGHHSTGTGDGGSHLHVKVKANKEEADVDVIDGALCDLPPDTAGDVEVTVSQPGRAPLIVVQHLARPGWVSGRVTAVAQAASESPKARPGSPMRQCKPAVRVTLRLDPSEGKATGGSWLICSDEPNHDILVYAAVSAYAAGSPIALYVDDVSAESPVHRFQLNEVGDADDVWLEGATW